MKNENESQPVAAQQHAQAALSDDQLLAMSDHFRVTFTTSDGHRESPYNEGYDITCEVVEFGRAIQQQMAEQASHDQLIGAEDKGYVSGLRVGFLEGASILREVYVNHVYATGASGLEARCKEAEQVLIVKADSASQRLPASPSAPEPCVDPAACNRQGCANPRGRCEEAAPAIQAQESAALDKRTVFENEANDARFFPAEINFSRIVSPSGRDEYRNSHLQSRWEGWQARAALAAPVPVQPAPVADATPGDSLSQRMELPELNADLFDILGRPCFTCIKVAQRLREMGRVIPQRAENEQAETIYLFLSTYLKHGAKWRDEVEAYLKHGTAKPSEEA